MYSAHTFTRKIAFRIVILLMILAALIAVKIAITREASVLAVDIRTHNESVRAFRASRDESLALLSSFAKVAGNEGKIRAAFPPADYIVPFTDALNAAAERAAVKVDARYGNPVETTSILPPETVGGTPEKLYTIDVSLTVEGDAKALEQFLREVEALPYYLTITGMRSTSAVESGWESMQRASIAATLYAKH